MMRGELVHIPQGTILLDMPEWTGSLPAQGYTKIDRPRRALFWEDIDDTGIAGIAWCHVFYKGQMWTVKKKDVYPIYNTGVENVDKTSRSVPNGHHGHEQ